MFNLQDKHWVFLRKSWLSEPDSIEHIIGMVERAERSISLQKAKKIADALNEKLDTLLNNGEES